MSKGSEVLAPMSALTRAQTYFVDEDQCCALVGPVMVVIARQEPSREIAKMADSCVTALERKYRGKLALMVVIKSEVNPPSEEARVRIKDAMRTCERAITVGAIVVEGHGFVATAMRSALSMMLFVVRPKFPVKVFNLVDDGASHVCAGLDRDADLTGATLSQAVRELRGAYDAGTLRSLYK
jgi:hypothetical protein